MKARYWMLPTVIAVLFPLCISCSKTQIAGGTDTETGGTMVVGYISNSDGTPALNTIVTLIPTDYNPGDTASTAALLTDTTDADGVYTITTSIKGKYNIQAFDAQSCSRLILYGVNCVTSIVPAPLGVLKTPGSVRLFLPDSIDSMNDYCYIPGTEFLAWLTEQTDYIVIDSVPIGVVPSIRYSSAKSTESTVLRNGIPVTSGDTTTVYNPEWQYCSRISLNTSPSGADVNGDVVQFPVIIRLNSGNFDFSKAKTDGADIWFAKNDNTPLPYEIEYWDAGRQSAQLWVRVDTIRGNNSAQSILIYWGNAAAVNSSSGDKAFDTAAGFQGVWHLNEKGNDTARDATANHFDGVAYNMAGAAPAYEGPIGNGRAFDGDSSYITMPNTASGKLNFPEDSFFTVSVWVYADTFDNAFGSIVSKSLRQYGLWLTYFPLNSPKWEFFDFTRLTNWNTSTSPATSKQWVLLTGIRAGSFQYLYCNGEMVAARNGMYPNGLPRDTTDNLAIGRFLKEAIYPLRVGYCFFKGSIKEVRICNVARDADWERLTYMNQRSDDKLVQMINWYSFYNE